ncbi:MAG: CAP domain-containing protein [Cyanobacteria bacterium J06597_1]
MPIHPKTDSFDREFLRLVNQARQARGIKPLQMSEKLDKAADLYSEEMIRTNHFAHRGPKGEEFYVRIQRQGYNYTRVGENLASGYPTAQSAFNGLMNSPGHRANILNRSFTHMGLGYAAGKNGATRWTQTFGAGDPNPGKYLPTGGNPKPPSSPNKPRNSATDGNDVFQGSAKNDQFFGKGGNDRLSGGGGNDTLGGGNGNDRLLGENGNDFMKGGQGNDRLLGGRGNDRLLGNGGDDLLDGQSGRNTLVGGAGRDRFKVSRSNGPDLIQDFQNGQDRIDLAGGLTFQGISLRKSGKNVSIIDGSGETIAILANTQLSQLNAADFI